MAVTGHKLISNSPKLLVSIILAVMTFSPKAAATVATHSSNLHPELIQNVLTLKPEPKFPDMSANYAKWTAAKTACEAGGGTFNTDACQQPAPPPPPVVVAPVVSQTYIAPVTAGNGYDWGQCTWFVKNMRPDIPNNWGNAGSWLYSAQGAGYATGYLPRAGAIGTEAGHVVYIQSVNADGTVNVSEMNWNGGVGVIHYRTTTATEFVYIY